MRLKKQLDRLQRQSMHRPKELTFERFFELVEPSSQMVLQSILQRLCIQGAISQWFRVVTDSGEAINDYMSLIEIPDEIENWRTGQMVSVTPDNLEVIYKIESQALKLE